MERSDYHISKMQTSVIVHRTVRCCYLFCFELNKRICIKMSLREHLKENLSFSLKYFIDKSSIRIVEKDKKGPHDEN